MRQRLHSIIACHPGGTYRSAAQELTVAWLTPSWCGPVVAEGWGEYFVGRFHGNVLAAEEWWDAAILPLAFYWKDFACWWVLLASPLDLVYVTVSHVCLVFVPRGALWSFYNHSFDSGDFQLWSWSGNVGKWMMCCRAGGWHMSKLPWGVGWGTSVLRDDGMHFPIRYLLNSQVLIWTRVNCFIQHCARGQIFTGWHKAHPWCDSTLCFVSNSCSEKDNLDLLKGARIFKRSKRFIFSWFCC